MDDKLQKLYENIKGSYDLPAFDVFKSDMSDPVKSQKLHQALVTDNYDVPDYDTFINDLGLKKKASPIDLASQGQTVLQELGQPLNKSSTQPLPSTSDYPVQKTETFTSPEQTPTIEQPKRKTTVIGDVLRSLKSGSMTALGGIAGVPNFLTRTVASFTTRPLIKAFGGTDQDAENAINASMSLNPLGQVTLGGEKAQQKLNALAAKTDAKIYPIEGNITKNIQEGDFGQAGELLVRGIFQSAPYLAMTLATAGGGTAAVLSTIGATAASQQYGSLEGKPETKKLLNSWLYGGFEAAGELVTAGIARGIGTAFRQAATQEAKDSLIKGAVKEIVKDFGLESSSEAATQIGQNLTDIITDVDPNRKIFDYVIDAGLIGGVSGSGLGVAHLSASVVGRALAADKEVTQVQDNVNQQKVIIDQIETTDSNPVKTALESRLKNLKFEANKIMDVNYLLADKMTPEQKSMAAEFYSVWNQLQSKIDNNEVTEEEVPAIENTIQGIKDDIQALKEKVTTEIADKEAKNTIEEKVKEGEPKPEKLTPEEIAKTNDITFIGKQEGEDSGTGLDLYNVEVNGQQATFAVPVGSNELTVKAKKKEKITEFKSEDIQDGKANEGKGQENGLQNDGEGGKNDGGDGEGQNQKEDGGQKEKDVKQISPDAQDLIDVIALDPYNANKDKYRKELQNKFNINFDDIYKDEQYIKDANLITIKLKNDFLNWDNYVTYSKEINRQRGFLNDKDVPLELQMARAVDISAKDIQTFGKKHGFTTKIKEYTGEGNLAGVLGNEMRHPSTLGTDTFIHELGHIIQDKLNYTGIASELTRASSSYGSTKTHEVFAENFQNFFLNPIELSKKLPEVYSELEKIIPEGIKKDIYDLLGVKPPQSQENLPIESTNKPLGENTTETPQNQPVELLSPQSDTNIPPTGDNATNRQIQGENGQETRFRQTQVNALIQDQTLQQQEVAKIVDANKERYTVMHGEEAIPLAKKMINEQGVANATIDLSERTKHMDDYPMRQVARQVLLDFYSRAIVDKNATEVDKEIAFNNITRLQQITAREATKAGQGNAMLDVWRSMQPSGLLAYVARGIEKGNQKILDRVIGGTTKGQQIDELYKTLTEESKKIIDDIIAGRKVKVSKEGEKLIKGEPTPRKTVPKERIKQEQEYRKSLIEQYKKSQGGTMSLSVTGFTSAQIELAGNFLGSYVREGYYRTQDFIDNLKKDFKDVGVNLDDKQASELLDTRKDNKERYNEFADRKESVARVRAGEKLASKKIDSVLKEHFTEKDELKRTLAQKLMDEIGLTESEAKKIGKEVLDQFDGEIVKRSQKLMTKLIGTEKIPTEKKSDGIMKKMIDLVNLGALDEGLYRDLFAEKFGLMKLTDQHKMEILRLANNVQEASDKGWVERNATIRLAKYVYELYPQKRANEIMETWIGMTYANTLMGISTTVLNFWSQGSNMSLKPVRDLVNFSKWIKLIRGEKNEGKADIYNPFGEMFYTPMLRGSAMGWNEAKEVYKNGDLNNKYVEDIAKKGQFKVTPLERDKFGKAKRFKPNFGLPINLKIGNTKLDFNIFNLYKYSGRNLAAQDKFMLTTSYDVEVVNILRDKLRTKDLTGRALTKKVMEIYRGDKIDQEKLNATIESDAQLYKKLTGEDMTDIQRKIRKRELTLEQLPLTKEERDEAEQLARSNIFTDSRSGMFGTLAHGLSIAANSSPVSGVLVKPFVMFTTVVGNVSEYMMDATPLYGFMRANGLGFSAIKKVINPEWGTSQLGEKGTRAYYEQMGRAWFGTLAFAGALAFLLGKDDKDKIQLSGGYGAEGIKKSGRENVMPKYSLRIRGIDIPYLNIPGLAVPLAIIGNINDGLKAGVDEGDLSDRFTASLLLDAGMRSVTMMKDMSFVDGIQNLATLVGNVASTDEKKWGQIGTDVTKTYLGFALRPLPQNNNAVQQIWKIFDPKAYSQGDIKSMLAYTAGLQHFVNKPKIDQLGDIVKTYPGETLLPYTHWLGLKGKDERWKFLSEYNAIPTKNANRTFQIETKDGIEKRKLDEDELYDYANRAGTLFSDYVKSYMKNETKVAKRGAEIIEREKSSATGEMEKITGIKEDMEKAWARAKRDAETELFKWGSVKEDKPKVWNLIKANEAYQQYQTAKKTTNPDGTVYKWNKSELYEFNNMATLRYADKVEQYLLGDKSKEDKTKPVSKADKVALAQEIQENKDEGVSDDGISMADINTKFDLKTHQFWIGAKGFASGQVYKQIHAKIKQAEKDKNIVK